MMKLVEYMYVSGFLTKKELTFLRNFSISVEKRIFLKAKKILKKWKKVERISFVQFLFLTKDGWVSIVYNKECELEVDKKIYNRYYIRH